MKTKNENYREIAEMTGLTIGTEQQSAEQRMTARQHDKNDSAAVGTFARVGNHYGLIDDVTEHGYGFVYSSPDGSWTGSLVGDFTPLTDAADVEKAKKSAAQYFTLELDYCGCLLHVNSSIIDKQRVADIIATCKDWLEALK